MNYRYYFDGNNDFDKLLTIHKRKKLNQKVHSYFHLLFSFDRTNAKRMGNYQSFPLPLYFNG